MRRVDEGAPLRARLVLLDPDDVRTVPTTLRYRVDCRTTGTALIGWTETTPALTVDVIISSEYNRIVNPRNRVEIKVFTIESNAGMPLALKKEFEYEVVNLYAVR